MPILKFSLKISVTDVQTTLLIKKMNPTFYNYFSKGNWSFSAWLQGSTLTYIWQIHQYSLNKITLFEIFKQVSDAKI